MTNRSADANPTELSAEVGQTWRHFLQVYEPLRPVLYRFCRYLTRSPWDADRRSVWRARSAVPQQRNVPRAHRLTRRDPGAATSHLQAFQLLSVGTHEVH